MASFTFVCVESETVSRKVPARCRDFAQQRTDVCQILGNFQEKSIDKTGIFEQQQVVNVEEDECQHSPEALNLFQDHGRMRFHGVVSSGRPAAAAVRSRVWTASSGGAVTP